MDRTHVNYTDELRGLHLKAVLMEDYPIDFRCRGGEIERCDFYIWFASAIGYDAWFAFALSDDPYEPETALENSDSRELQIMSVWMGCRDEDLANGCPHCIAGEQRDRFHALDEQVIHGLHLTPLKRLAELREIASLQSGSMYYEKSTGLDVSLN